MGLWAWLERAFLLLGLGLYAIVAVYWWVYLKIDSQAIAGVFAVYFLLGLGTACWTIANLNYLPQVTGDTERTLMVSIHGAVTACIGGIPNAMTDIKSSERMLDSKGNQRNRTTARSDDSIVYIPPRWRVNCRSR